MKLQFRRTVVKEVFSILLSLIKQEPKLTNSNSSSSDCTQQTRGITELLKIALLSKMKEKVTFVRLDFYLINNVNLPPESVNNTTTSYNTVCNLSHLIKDVLKKHFDKSVQKELHKNRDTTTHGHHTQICNTAVSGWTDAMHIQLSKKIFFIYNRNAIPASLL